MLNLKFLKVKGFRGFVKEREFDFEHPAVFLFGENRCGKSSTLNAVEWCLFGDECIGVKTGMRERHNYEIPNRNMKTEDTYVELSLEDINSNDTYKVYRKYLSARKDQLVLTLPDGTTLTNQNANEKLGLLVKSTFRDFMTTVYQHQEAIRAVVTQEPAERNDAIDRLLGLSVYRNLLTDIDKANLKSELRDMGKELDSFTKQIEVALKTRESDLRDEKDNAIEKGLKEKEINEKGGLKISNDVLKQLKEFSKVANIELQDLKAPENREGLGDFLNNANSEINRLRSEMPDVKEQEKLFEHQSKIARIKTNYESEKKTFDQLSKDLKKFEKEHGDEKGIKKKKEDLDKKLKGKKDDLSQANAKAAAIQDSINYLKLEGVDKDICPVCNKKTKNLLGHLEKEWEKKYENQVGEIQNEIEDLQGKVNHIEQTQKEYKSLNEDIKSAKDDMEDVIKEVSESLNKDIKKSDDPLALLNKQLDEIGKKLKSLEQAVKTKQETLDNISSILKNVQLIVDIMKHEEKKKIVEQIQVSTEFKRVEQLKTQMALLVDDVDKIKEAVSGASHNEAEHKVNAAGKIINDYFKRITDNPLVKNLDFSVSVDSKNKNFYKFTDQDDEEITPILNQGDLNALALAIFLGMLREESIFTPFGFAMMDDPSQSMDSKHKENFVEVLEDILDKKMVILSTMDSELQGLLNKNITKAKTKYMFKKWNPKDGVQISED